MRVLVAIIGALLAWSVHHAASGLPEVLLGAFAGYAAVELFTLRQRIETLERRRLTDSAPERPVTSRQTVPTAPREAAAAGSDTPWNLEASRPVMGASKEAAQAPLPEWRLAPRLAEYFSGGNTLVWVGVLLLFFGVAFLLRYIAEHTHLPLQLRLAAVAAGGAALLLLGWSLRRRRRGYALTLQGGGVGILYLTAFAALHFAVLPPLTTFVTLVALAAVSAVLAVLQDSRAFAVLAVTGGFLAPILASAGEEQPVLLFTYYAILNGSVFAIAWHRSWRELNLVGFVFTFVIATAWGVLRYHEALFAITEPFLALFFLLYLAIAILFAFRQPPQLRGYVDATMVFGTPIAAFGYQSAMLHDRPLTLAASALVLAALYLLLSWLLDRLFRATHRLLAEAFFALGVVFFTVAVPLGLSSHRSAATWALEAAALIWIGCRQLRPVGRALGALLVIGSGVLYARDIGFPAQWLAPVDGFLLPGALVGAAAIFSATTFRRYMDRLLPYERAVPSVLFFWGLGWWLYSGLLGIDRYLPGMYAGSAWLVFLTATALAASEIHRRTSLGGAQVAALGLLPVMMLLAVVAPLQVSHPLGQGGWLAWPLAFAGFYVICHRHEGERGAARALHTGSAWLITGLVTWEVAYQLGQITGGLGSWSAIGWALVPGIFLAALPRLVPRLAWPLRRHQDTYLRSAGGGIAAYLVCWSFLTNLTLPGDPYPFAYVPVLNVLDVAEVLVLLLLAAFWRQLVEQFALPGEGRHRTIAEGALEACLPAALVALTFLWLNAALLRGVHFWAAVPYQLDAMLRSTLVQTALSIFWTALALTAMVLATGRRSRLLWLSGAGLLSVVIVKLFLIDLSRIGTLERVVSFIGVGVLTLVIGYFSPLPPRPREVDAIRQADR